MRQDWGDSAIADDCLRRALARAAGQIEADPRSLNDLREEDLRRAVHQALSDELPGHVRKERALDLPAFRGVGPFDVLVDSAPGGQVVWLAEVKWSYTSRSKIFEAVWDAVKLCHAADTYSTGRSWLITGAPNSQWAIAEARRLFSDGSVSLRDLWEERLIPPGPNGGKTSGEDLLAGGRGNLFTRSPSAFAVAAVAREDLRKATEDWSIRAVALRSDGPWIEDFAPSPVFPRIIRQPWLDSNVPGMSDEAFAELIDWLRLKRWTDRDLSERVFPLRRAGDIVRRDA